MEGTGHPGRRVLREGSKQLSSGVAVQVGGSPWFAASVHTRAELVPGPQAKADVEEPGQGACSPDLSSLPHCTCPWVTMVLGFAPVDDQPN